MKTSIACLMGLCLVAASPAPTEMTPPVTPQQAPNQKREPCASPEFQQFDFWLGIWSVKSPDGKQLGTSEITRVSGGCAIWEKWTSNKTGYSGMSINHYDPQSGRWNQRWVGSDGGALNLQGGLEKGSMVLQGESKNKSGAIIDRITWTPLADGKVQQEWAKSTDGGKTWKTNFVGIYHRATSASQLAPLATLAR